MITVKSSLGSNFHPELQQNYKVEEVRQPVRIILDRQHLVTPRHKLFQCQSRLAGG